MSGFIDKSTDKIHRGQAKFVVPTQNTIYSWFFFTAGAWFIGTFCCLSSDERMHEETAVLFFFSAARMGVFLPLFVRETGPSALESRGVPISYLYVWILPL